MDNEENRLKEIMNLLKQKKELLGELLNLSQYHKKFCREERFDKLNRLVKSQYLKINKLNKIDKQAEMINRNLNGILEISASSEQEDDDNQNISQFRALKEEISSLLIEFYRINQNNQDIVWSSYQRLREKILNINRAKKVKNIYEKPVKTCGFFVDRRENIGYKKGRF